MNNGMQFSHAALDNLELIARQVVEGFIIGLHKSPFHGFSVEFAEHRIYNQGDPLRHIDWRVYGRTEKLFVKRFEEETNLRCCMVLDTSASMHFPDEKDKPSKLEFGAIAAASIIQLLKRQLDAAALAFFNDTLYHLSDCRSSHTHYRQLIHQLENVLKTPAPQAATNAAAALHQVAEQMHKRSLVVVFSDMMDDTAQAEELFAALQHLKYNKHEVILFHIIEGRLEKDFTFENRPYEFVDMESGERVRLQPHQVKESYIGQMAAFRQLVENRAHQYQIDYVPVDLSEPVAQVLHSFLVKRNKMI
jgi:uncharacterized protein (DUF58 family)